MELGRRTLARGYMCRLKKIVRVTVIQKQTTADTERGPPFWSYVLNTD